MPAMILSCIPALEPVVDGVTINENNSLIASVDGLNHCVRIYNIDAAGSLTAPPLVVGTPGTAGTAHGQLNCPVFACFVHRNGTDTLLICDAGNDRIVEISASGDFCRAVAVKTNSFPFGIAYCGSGDVIAVSLYGAHAVLLLQYESGAVKPDVTIGLGAAGNGDGQLWAPLGITFTADGRHILVADYGNDRVSKFNAVSGAFITHLATKAANGIQFPRDIIQCEDGSILVAVTQCRDCSPSVVCVGEDGVKVKNIIFTSAIDGGVLSPYSLSYSSSLIAVVVKTLDGSVFLLRSTWMSSSRCAWLSAVCVR